MSTPIETNTEELREILNTVNELPKAVNPNDFVKKERLTITLPASGWSNLSQSVTASGVTTDADVIVSPASGSHDAYCEAVIRCDVQAANRLTFSCLEKPSNNLTVNILILKQGGSA